MCKEGRGPDVVVALIESKHKPEHFLVQYRNKNNGQYAGMLEFPGGKVNPGEALFNAVCREVLEEVGLTVSMGKKFVSMDFCFPSGLYHNVHFYVVSADQYEGEPCGNEGQRIGWITLYQIMTYPTMLPLNRSAATLLTTIRNPDILD